MKLTKTRGGSGPAALVAAGEMTVLRPPSCLPAYESSRNSRLLVFVNTPRLKVFIPFVAVVIVALPLAALSPGAHAAEPPKVGEIAPNFALHALDGRPVELNQVLTSGPVVLVVLRGWPGYQCPICTRQVQDFIGHSGEFAAQKAQVLMVYPGPADNLKAHAQEFLTDKNWPKEYRLVIDPDYAFTMAYGLRWDAEKETAYPSTFIIDGNRKVRFAQVSKSHGDRVSAKAGLETLQTMK